MSKFKIGPTGPDVMAKGPDDSAEVEEDGDEVATPMQVCLRWGCGGQALVERGGWMKCPVCHVSYGPAVKGRFGVTMSKKDPQ